MDRHTLFRVLAAVLAGIAVSASDAATPPTSEGLVAVQSRSLDEIYVRPNANLSAYRKIVVDPGQATLKKNWLKDINSQRDMTRWLVPEDAQRRPGACGFVACAERRRGVQGNKATRSSRRRVRACCA